MTIRNDWTVHASSAGRCASTPRPDTSRRTTFKVVATVIAVLAAAYALTGAAHAASDRQTDFQHDVAPLYEMSGTATSAANCNLRSRAWEYRINVGLRNVIMVRQRTWHLSEAEREAAEDVGLRSVGGVVRHYFPDHCGELRNSSRISALDAFDDNLTGGYH